MDRQFMKYFIMHETAMDVCFELDKIQYQDSKILKLKGSWWNLGYSGKPYKIESNVKLTINTDDWLKWKKFDYGMLTTKRTKSGMPK